MGAIRYVLLFIALGGCTATMIDSSDRIGGQQDGPRWGILRYQRGWSDTALSMRQASAREQMEEYCAPQEYRIADQHAEREYRTVVTSSYAQSGSVDIVYVRFECVPAKTIDTPR
jgi:hypothetical protein